MGNPRISEKVSAYIVFSDKEFLSSSGRKWRVIYGTRKAKLLAVRFEIAEDLARLVVPDCDPATLSLLRHEFIVGDGEVTERATLTRRSAENTTREGSRTFVLLPTTFCNMGCTYCGQEHFKSRLSQWHREAIIQQVTSAISDQGVHETTVSWFGAEPMMANSLICQMSSKFVEAARSHEVHYQARMTTNGSLLTVEKLVKLHAHCNLHHIEITLDGAGDVHDSHRPLKSGGKSFEKIVTTVSQALRHPELNGLTFGIRTNVDRRNVDSVPEYISRMVELGFQDPRVRFKFSPIHSWLNDISEIELAKERFAKLEATWLSMLLNRGLHFDILPTAQSPNVCVAVDRKAETITSNGEMFACIEHPLVPVEAGRAIGRLTELELTSGRPDGPYDTWIEDRVSGRFPCADCVLLGVCGGHCPKLWMQGSAACPSYRYNIQDRLDLAARVHGLTPIVA